MPPTQGDLKAIHLLVEGEEAGLQFFQSIIVLSTDPEHAAQRLADHLNRRGARLVDVDSEETSEVNLETVPAEWKEKAVPEDGIVAMAGRIWVDPSHAPKSWGEKLSSFFENLRDRLRGQ